MPPLSVRFLPLDPGLDRRSFCCGQDALDSYFWSRLTQDIRRRMTACFVAVTEAQQIAGFYTLASSSVPLVDLPSELARKLPRYPSVPCFRMGQLAVDSRFRSQGIGAALLADALQRALNSEIAAYALIVDAKDETAANFYLHHGFVALPDSPLTLFLPLATAQEALRAAGL